mmetsp:Transcript_40707/g.97671  ORF Transcript_40707/g.97671 Transcript_40707/m.97671 type:complete len:84 (-) Transcript_40707:69-320(-)
MVDRTSSNSSSRARRDVIDGKFSSVQDFGSFKTAFTVLLVVMIRYICGEETSPRFRSKMVVAFQTKKKNSLTVWLGWLGWLVG